MPRKAKVTRKKGLRDTKAALNPAVVAVAAAPRPSMPDGDGHECPICFEDLSTPIYQCSQGHVLCGPCRAKFHACPSCNEKLSASAKTYIRNRALEQIIEGHKNTPKTPSVKNANSETAVSTPAPAVTTPGVTKKLVTTGSSRNRSRRRLLLPRQNSAPGLLTSPAPAQAQAPGSPEVQWIADVSASTAPASAPAKTETPKTSRFRRTPTHKHIFCDGPDCKEHHGKKAIEGVRYRCMECEDYDLCESCERKGVHDKHLLLRIAKPGQSDKAYKIIDGNAPKKSRRE